jgi:hypothetical protein
MFFPAFSERVTLELPEDTVFTVEYLTSQILVNADPPFLEQALARGNFIEALLQELEFFGQVRKADLPQVRQYLTKHEASLQDTAKIILKDPQHFDRRYLLSPLQVT